MGGIQVGLSNLYYAILTSDTPSGATYQAPVQIAGAINAKISPKSNSETLYADDGPVETVSSLGEITVEMEVKDVDLDTQAALLGHSVVGGVLVKKSTDTAPYIALGFKSKKSNSKYRYVWLLKGKFEPLEAEHASMEDKPKFQTPKLKGTFIRREFDNGWQKITDEDHPNFVTATGNNWFAAVETVDTTIPTISSMMPANNATGVAVGTNVTWVFSEAIDQAMISDDNFIIFKDSDGSVVPGSLAYDSVNRRVTFTPTTNLSAATAYRALVSKEVRDLAGNKMAANTITKFTTA